MACYRGVGGWVGGERVGGGAVGLAGGWVEEWVGGRDGGGMGGKPKAG